MSMQVRLRSTSNSIDKHSESDSLASNEMDNGMCEICKKKNGEVLLTCSICAAQYHPMCLDIKSSLLEDASSWAFQHWSCKRCASCYYCRKKKVRRSSATQSLIKHFIENMNLKSNDLVACKQCDTSIHAFCLYKMKREKKNGDVSLREYKSEKKNHICNVCKGDDEDFEEDFEYGNDEEQSSDYGDDMETSHSDISDLDDEENAQRQLKLKNHLKKLGIMNVEEHLKNTSLNEKRKLRRSINNKISKAIVVTSDDTPTHSKQSILKKRKTDLTPSAKTDKNKRKQSESDDENQHSKKKLIKSKTKLKFEDIDEMIDEDEKKEGEQVRNKNSCPVTDCDSKGHLSGQYDTHRNIETCPLFHNQTIEQCVQRNRQIQRDSPSKRNRKVNKNGQPLESNPKWALVMENRRLECNSNNNYNDTVITNLTSNRQPNLEGFTPQFDLELFRNAESRNAELIHLNSALELRSDDSDGKSSSNNDDNNDDEDEDDLSQQSSSSLNDDIKDKSIIFAKYEIGVWYPSPYSDDFQNCLKLFICEYCLKCMNSLIVYQRHINKCTIKHPPGDEIYRKGSISFFEIDGNKQKEFCQNLCLMAKLFLEHKTLFFDVETFLFYIMTQNDDEGMHIVGYFSKEKYSVQGYNVSCILTLPHYQRTGYGRMLIDFSYLLTKTEKKVGSPERPLSDLGLLSYRNYWKFTIKEYLSTYTKKEINIKEMSMATGISAIDLITTLQLMRIIKYWKGIHIIILDEATHNQFTMEVKQKKKLYGDKMIDPKYLSWTPNSWLTARPKPTA